MEQNLGKRARELAEAAERRNQELAKQQRLEQAKIESNYLQAEIAHASEIKKNLQQIVEQAVAENRRSLRIFETGRVECWQVKVGYWSGFLDHRYYYEWRFKTLPFVQDLFNYCQTQGLSPKWDLTEPDSGTYERRSKPASLAIDISW
jgi:hypothetical protein